MGIIGVFSDQKRPFIQMQQKVGASPHDSVAANTTSLVLYGLRFSFGSVFVF